ncbi:MAG: RNA polymerase sigma-54 factor [Gemmatimonadales bacterium]|nr:MAG: RNA polymerase sigma-54 factor [Gemmatimonadales bacterium]
MSGFSNRLYQSTELRQEMKINPRLYQAMELLYMPLLDLQAHLKQELTENPFLEMSEADVQDDVSIDEEGTEKKDEDEIDWEEILLDGFDAGGSRAQYEETERHERTPVGTSDLRDHLLEQLHHLPIKDREVRMGEEIIGNIDDDGFLSCGLDEVLDGVNEWLVDIREVAQDRAAAIADTRERAEEEAEVAELFRDYTLDEAEDMLGVVQRMDPAGVGARDLRESILIQLRDRDLEDTLAHTLVRDHFDDFIQHRWTELGRSIGVSAREVQSAADQVAKLDPKPGIQYGPDRDPYIIPDLIVEKIDGEYHVFLNDTSLPRLRLSRSYREVAQDRGKYKGENKEFIASKLNSANWMIQAIEQRRQTMLKVMNFIVDRQREFFEKGIQFLRPLTLREVADYIEMHESTVSRVTNEKYVQTPRGVYHLKFFFSSGLSTTSGQDISARGVKDKIRKLVDQENAKKPLTDQKIVNLLETDGIQIARRTVAKYRDQLGILPARMRKRV